MVGFQFVVARGLITIQFFVNSCAASKFYHCFHFAATTQNLLYVIGAGWARFQIMEALENFSKKGNRLEKGKKLGVVLKFGKSCDVWKPGLCHWWRLEEFPIYGRAGKFLEIRERLEEMEEFGSWERPEF